MIGFISETYNYLMPKNSFLTLEAVIWVILGGFAAGLIASYYNKTYTAETVRRLVKNRAASPESAKTLEEIGLKPTRARVHSLKEGSSMRRYVEIANSDETVVEQTDIKRSWLAKFLFPYRKKYTYDFENAKLYIPEDKKAAAEVRYEEKVKFPPVMLIVLLILLAAVGVAATIGAPKILKVIDNLITSIVQK